MEFFVPKESRCVYGTIIQLRVPYFNIFQKSTIYANLNRYARLGDVVTLTLF